MMERSTPPLWLFTCFLLLLSSKLISTAFSPQLGCQQKHFTSLQQSSFVADGSEYKSDKSDYDADDEDSSNVDNFRGIDIEEDETPTVELSPVPLSKNAGNRFLVMCWDQQLNTRTDDPILKHEHRIDLTEDHVMFCRKQNLYNETFNTESMVDVRFSYQMLSSDLERTIGHVMCLESTALEHVQDTMSRDPIIQMLTGGDISNIPYYRWRHIRDYTLRVDDGRDGFPCLCVGLDHDDLTNIRSDLFQEQLETLIRSERIIATGPLHVPTLDKDDPDSVPVGDAIFFNAQNRQDAIEFIEGLPYAQAGLYQNLRVNFFNQLDVTGKFVSEDPLRNAPGAEMQEALEYWGYPTSDDQTPWLNC